MSSLALYRTLVPDHVDVADGLVTTWLGIAARRHTASAFGDLYAEAMVWWTAHRIQRTPSSGAPGASSASEVGAVTSQRDGDLSRTYAEPGGSAPETGSDAELRLTTYGQLYLDIRNTRAARAPTVVAPVRP